MARPRNINDILDVLHNVKSAAPGKWTADCPVAGHKTPGGHLSIENTGTKTLVTFFPTGGHSYADICQVLGFETLSYGIAEYHDGKSLAVLIKTYDYQDEDGKLLYQICRYLPNTFKARRPDGNGG